MLNRAAMYSQKTKQGDKMLNQSTAVQSQEEISRAKVCLGAEVDRMAMATVFIAAGMVGVWTLARIVSALYTSGGPIVLFQSWLAAVSGGGL